MLISIFSSSNRFLSYSTQVQMFFSWHSLTRSSASQVYSKAFWYFIRLKHNLPICAYFKKKRMFFSPPQSRRYHFGMPLMDSLRRMQASSMSLLWRSWSQTTVERWLMVEWQILSIASAKKGWSKLKIFRIPKNLFFSSMKFSSFQKAFISFKICSLSSFISAKLLTFSQDWHTQAILLSSCSIFCKLFWHCWQSTQKYLESTICSTWQVSQKHQNRQFFLRKALLSSSSARGLVQLMVISSLALMSRLATMVRYLPSKY